MSNVVIFGATSAIASEAAVRYARRGDRLHLVGRDEDKLRRVVDRCGGDQCTFETADFTDLGACSAVVERAVIALDGTIDLALIAHGELGDQPASERDLDVAEKIITVNFTSVVALLIPLSAHMVSRRAGKLGVITSVAGDRGRPRNYTYGAAKGGLSVYLQGLRTRLVSHGVSVTTLKLGPVDTPMTREHTKHFLFGKPRSVARDIVRAIDQKTPVAYVPWFWAAIMPLVKATPEGVFQKLPFLSGR